MAKQEDNCEPIEIKEAYNKFQKKYSLPDFKEMNEDFDIAKIDCTSETLLRDVRKNMMVKLSATLQLVELLLNPSNGSMFHMFLVKGVNGSEKSTLEKLFDRLGQIEINSYSRDITYDEKKEAEFINTSYSHWKEVQQDMDRIVGKLKENWSQTTSKKSKSYFG